MRRSHQSVIRGDGRTTVQHYLLDEVGFSWHCYHSKHHSFIMQENFDGFVDESCTPKDTLLRPAFFTVEGIMQALGKNE